MSESKGAGGDAHGLEIPSETKKAIRAAKVGLCVWVRCVFAVVAAVLSMTIFLADQAQACVLDNGN